MVKYLVMHVLLHRCVQCCPRFLVGIFALCLLITLSACGARSADSNPATELPSIRSPHPTFTPTPLPAAPVVQVQGETQEAPPAGEPAVEQVEQAPPPPPADIPVRLVINTEFVNLRERPGVGADATIITILDEGYELDVLGKNAAGDWWFVCCFEDRAGWVTAEFAEVSGPVEQVPVVSDDATPQSAAPTPTAEAVAVAPPPAPATEAEPPTTTSAPPPATELPTSEVAVAESPAPAEELSAASVDYPFTLIATEQFPEPNVVRIYLYVFSGNEALAGYTLRVTKDGVEQPVSESSFGPNSAYTWPVADPRQRAQNMKVEFDIGNVAGVWEVQLMRNGTPMGPSATFTLSANEPNRELYVRYQER